MSWDDRLAVPLDVPPDRRELFKERLDRMTGGTGKLMLFAGDQKVEHLNDDFHGDGISYDDGDPEHLFRIASQGKIGAFATQFGMIARYAGQYRDVPYVVKLNSKTNLVKAVQAEPTSRQWLSVDDVATLGEENDLDIVGVGYTVYLGSEHEAAMLSEAARMVHRAHRLGMTAVLWMYPRGRAVRDERGVHLVAGAAGVGACLGADFVKLNCPTSADMATGFEEVVRAAGRTGVVCSGGSRMNERAFLESLHRQMGAGARGSATGRNIHQRPLSEAVRFCEAIHAVTVKGASVSEAMELFREDPGA